MQGGSNQFLGFVNLFSGGALEQLSIFALGVMPYISASIIFQLLGFLIPSIQKMQKEGEQGRQKINQYTRYAAVLIAAVQGLLLTLNLDNFKIGNRVIVDSLSPLFVVSTVVTLSAGTVFVMWLGEQIAERGIGNGMSILIFAGIIARLPAAILHSFSALKSGTLQPLQMLELVVFVSFSIVVVIFFERGQRKIPIQYPKRGAVVDQFGQTQSSNSLSMSHLPLKVNSAGVMPPILASSVMIAPLTLANYVHYKPLQDFFQAFRPGSLIYNVVFALLIVFFSYFYTAVTFNPVDVADNIKKNGGFIPGIRPGKNTAEFIDFVLSRITVAGAAYITMICLIPSFLLERYGGMFYFGGTSLLIVVGVALDTVSQIESHLIMKNYEGFSGSKGPRIRGRRDF